MKILMALLVTGFFGCADGRSIADEFRKMKTECSELAQKLGTDYHIDEDVSVSVGRFNCTLIDKRVDYRYGVGSIEAVAGAKAALYIANHLETNVAFNKCLDKEIPGATLGGNKYTFEQRVNATHKCEARFPNRRRF